MEKGEPGHYVECHAIEVVERPSKGVGQEPNMGEFGQQQLPQAVSETWDS
jgi:hypothetical protein